MLLQVVESPVPWQISFKRESKDFFEKSKNLGEKGNLASVNCVCLYRESSVSNNHCCLHLIRTLLQHSRAEPGRRILFVWKPESRTPRNYHRVFLWWLPAAGVTPLVLSACLFAKWFPSGNRKVPRFPSLTLFEYTNYLMSWRLYRPA